jgi:hypothetical protein
MWSFWICDSAREGGLFVVRHGLRQNRQELTIVLRPLHVVEAPLQVPSAAREFAIGDRPDIERGEVAVDVAQLQTVARDVALQRRHGLFGEDVRVGIDRAQIGHSQASLIQCDYRCLVGVRAEHLSGHFTTCPTDGPAGGGSPR